MKITIRKATEADINTIQTFGSKLLNYERENYDPSLDGDWAFTDQAKAIYLKAIQEQYVIIASIDDAPAGFLIGNIIQPKPQDARKIKQANLQNVYVDESQRRSGIGKQLVDTFKKYCVKEGVNRLNVSVLAANKTALSLYEKTGFRPRSINLSQEL